MPERVRSYEDLTVWKRSIQLVVEVHHMAKSFPADERFILGAQLRRAALSIPVNIAEGHGRGTSPDYVHFLTIARGSLYELSTCLVIAEALGYLTQDQLAHARSLAAEVGRMLNALRRVIAAKPNRNP
jgi:four helix bundle protein